jgi:hypothetical protein
MLSIKYLLSSSKCKLKEERPLKCELIIILAELNVMYHTSKHTLLAYVQFNLYIHLHLFKLEILKIEIETLQPFFKFFYDDLMFINMIPFFPFQELCNINVFDCT